MRTIVGIAINVEERFEGTFTVGQLQLPAVGESWVYANALYRVVAAPPNTGTSPPASIADGEGYWELQLLATAPGTALGTGTVLHFTQDAEYPNLANTTFTVDTTDAEVGVVVSVRLEASAPAPALPAGFVLLAGSYQAGQRHKYTFCVAPDGSIEYLITPLS